MMERYAARAREAIQRASSRGALIVIGGLVLTIGLFLPWFDLEWESFHDVTGLDICVNGANYGMLLAILTVLLWAFILANKPLPGMVIGTSLLAVMLHMMAERRSILSAVLWNRDSFWTVGPYPPLGWGSYVSVVGVIMVMASEFMIWRERKSRMDSNFKMEP